MNTNTSSNVLTTWTRVNPAESFTANDMQQLSKDLKKELEHREYVNVTCHVMISPPDFNCIMITGSAKPKLNTDIIYFHTAVGVPKSNDLDKLLPQINQMMEDKLPPLNVRLKKDFQKTFEQLAKIADRLGESVPEYNEFAQTLRESARSNLLEYGDKGQK